LQFECICEATIEFKADMHPRKFDNGLFLNKKIIINKNPEMPWKDDHS
jgi:hypothetical protein